jgi:hypothetical protein
MGMFLFHDDEPCDWCGKEPCRCVLGPVHDDEHVERKALSASTTCITYSKTTPVVRSGDMIRVKINPFNPRYQFSHYYVDHINLDGVPMVRKVSLEDDGEIQPWPTEIPYHKICSAQLQR